MSLNEFKTSFFGGTRQNRFLITGNFPTAANNQQNQNNNPVSGTQYLHVRSTLIPTLQTSTISYDYFGRKYHYPGEKLYSTWSVSVMDDNPNLVASQNNLWRYFQIWHNNINNHQTNLTIFESNENAYKVSWTVRHLDLNGGVLKTFILNGLWPRSINEVSFNMARPNVINTFNVVFVYDTLSILGVTDQNITR